MKRAYKVIGLIGLSVISLCPSLELWAQKYTQPWRIYLGPRFGFNIKADIKADSILPGSNIGPISGGGIDRFYDDGYVRVDSSGNQNGQTWFWGYESPAQLDLNAGTIAMHASFSATSYSATDVDNDPQPGGEIMIQRIVSSFGGALWGVEAGGFYQDININDSARLNSTITVVTDTYSLGGIIPPLPPYYGNFYGPGPKISDTPTRTLQDFNAIVTGSRKIDSSFFAGKVGPFLDIPMGEPLSIQLSGGVILGYLDSEFKRRELLIYENGLRQQLYDRATESDWLVGGYVRGQITLDFTDNFGVFAACEYQAMQDITLHAGPYRADLSLGNAVYGIAGFRIKF